MTEDDIARMKQEIDAALRRHVGFAQDPGDLAARMAKDLEGKLDPEFAACESVKVLEEDPEENLIREVMEEPRDEFKLEMSLRMRQPVQYIRCHLIVKS